jgi:hypothetical protein
MQRYKIVSSHASIPLYLFSISLRSTLNDKRSKSPPESTFPVKSQRNLEAKVNLFSMDLGDEAGG